MVQSKRFERFDKGIMEQVKIFSKLLSSVHAGIFQSTFYVRLPAKILNLKLYETFASLLLNTELLNITQI